MISAKFTAIFGVVAIISGVNADSAGIVEMPDGLAYGGIPYGSVSGMVAGYRSPIVTDNYYHRFNQYQPQRRQSPLPSPIIVTPNFRAANLAARKNGPVQIYQLPGVIAPGVVGTLSQIGY